MNPIETYGIIDLTGIHYKSPICSVAASVRQNSSSKELQNRIEELTQSFFNQWRFIIETYQRLYYQFNRVNSYSDISDDASISSDYEMFSLKHEIEFKDYSYLLIISIKTYLDLFACLVDISINQVVRNENQLPDFFNTDKSKIRNTEVINEFNKVRNANNYPWIFQIKGIRDKLIHRGYHLKPEFGFKKANELKIQLYKGTDLFNDRQYIVIGELFNSFMTDMPKIEEEISEVLIKNVELLNGELSCLASYTFGDFINNYVFKELIKPSR